MKLDYSNLGKCLEKILKADRQDWDKFHEDFVRILVDFGYGYCLTVEEKQWYDENKNEYNQNISEFSNF